MGGTVSSSFVARFFCGLELRALDREVNRFESAGKNFDHRLFRRFAILSDEHKLAIGPVGENRHRIAVADCLALRLASVGKLDVKKGRR